MSGPRSRSRPPSNASRSENHAILLVAPNAIRGSCSLKSQLAAADKTAAFGHSVADDVLGSDLGIPDLGETFR